MRCLMISPLPTVPETQGNAVRIASVCRLLQSQGVAVHFLCSAMEATEPDQISAMANEWDAVDVVPFRGSTARRAPRRFGLDDWFDQSLRPRLDALVARWRFDMAVVNYIWMSAAFEHVGPQTLKLLETHDRFGERDMLLARSGIRPTWFYTSEAEEARGLARADVVVAVQEREAAYFRGITCRPVETVGQILPLRFLEQVADAREVLAIGYVGSANPTNRMSMLRLLGALDQQQALCRRLRFTVAGPICAVIPERPWMEKLGVTENALSVYERVDCVVNPNYGGSGLKVKTIESLSFGLPVISTRDGAEGLESSLPAHRFETPEELAAALPLLLCPRALEALRRDCRSLIKRYSEEQKAAFRRTFLRGFGSAQAQ
jgi:hypothetical protein